MSEDIAVVADKVRTALAAADVEEFAGLLDPNVTWGAPGDNSPACQNRNQVLRWYQRGREEGRRGEVIDVITSNDKILIKMVVSTPEGGGADRWQVFRVNRGLVADIRGYEDEDSAMRAAGLIR